MSHNLKVFGIYFICFIIVFSVSRFLIGYLFPGLERLYILFGAAAITMILSPRLGRDDNGRGSRYQLRWIFRKEPLLK